MDLLLCGHHYRVSRAALQAIGGVVYGHWLLVDITCSGGQLSGRDAVDYVS